MDALLYFLFFRSFLCTISNAMYASLHVSHLSQELGSCSAEGFQHPAWECFFGNQRKHQKLNTKHLHHSLLQNILCKYGTSQCYSSLRIFVRAAFSRKETSVTLIKNCHKENVSLIKNLLVLLFLSYLAICMYKKPLKQEQPSLHFLLP